MLIPIPQMQNRLQYWNQCPHPCHWLQNPEVFQNRSLFKSKMKVCHHIVAKPCIKIKIIEEKNIIHLFFCWTGWSYLLRHTRLESPIYTWVTAPAIPHKERIKNSTNKIVRIFTSSKLSYNHDVNSFSNLLLESWWVD